MTFLEFVCRDLMGPPVVGKCWRCPFCDSPKPSFSVRPPKGDLPIKFKCHRCQEWGDQLDFMRLFYPEVSAPQRYRMLRELKREYDRSCQPGPDARRGREGSASSGPTRASTVSRSSVSSPPGDGTRGHKPQPKRS